MVARRKRLMVKLRERGFIFCVRLHTYSLVGIIMQP